MKNDLNMFLTLILAALLVAAADFDVVVKRLGEFGDAAKETNASENFAAFEKFKTQETEFWLAIKGSKSAGGDIAETLDDDIPAQTSAAPANEKIKTPAKFLLIGDSMMLVGFGPALENSLISRPNVSVVREGVYSTGLNRIDYFDWYAKTDELVARHRPDVVIVMFGGNDGQGIIDKNKKAHEFGSGEWKEVYRQRVAVFLSRLSPKVRRIYWVGHPITGNDGFLTKFQTMNPIYRDECAKFANATFIDSWERFAVNGVYRQSIPDDEGLWQIAKQSDGVHVTDFGGKILARLVLNAVAKDVEFEK